MPYSHKIFDLKYKIILHQIFFDARLEIYYYFSDEIDTAISTYCKQPNNNQVVCKQNNQNKLKEKIG